MAGKLQKKLQEAVKKLSYKTSVDQLKQRGIHKVNVVGLDRIVALVEAAVQRTLRARLQGFGTGEGGEHSSTSIAEATREEFLRLLRSNEELEKLNETVKAENDGLENEIDAMRRELLELRRGLAERQEDLAREERIRAAETDAELFEQLGAFFEAKGSPDLLAKVQEIFSERLDHERQLLTESRMREHRSEVEQLERRIRKLSGNLADTEGQLRSVLDEKEIDPGISSIYREVQGLDPKDLFFEKKQGLMASIFEANKALQQGAS